MINYLKKIDIKSVFCIIVFFTIIFTITFNAIVNGTYLRNDFRFFNVIMDHGVHVIGMADKTSYPDEVMVFPPFAYLIYDFFYHSDTTVKPNMKYWNVSFDTLHIYYFFAIIQLVILALIINDIFCTDKKVKRYLLTFSIIFSYPVFYAPIYQGNNVLTAVLLLLVAVLIIENEDASKFQKCIAMLFIAFAFGLKILPAIFGVEYIRRKRFKEALILIIIGFIVFFAPFWYFNGFDTILRYINVLSKQNIIGPSHTSVFYYLNLFTVKFFNFDIMINNYVVKILQVIILTVSLFTYFIAKKRWQRYLILGFLCYIMIPRSNIYYLFYYLIGLLFFLSDENSKFSFMLNSYNSIICVLFSLLFAVYLFHYTEFVHFMMSLILTFMVFINIYYNKFINNANKKVYNNI